MKTRSPVLGYNHNVRYAGRLWHVQTEDSGVQNPRLFTHLFHEGTILATKRVDYDPELDEPAVQKLMQTQHKGMLRELKAGAFDEKISRFLGAPIEHDVKDDRAGRSERSDTDPGMAVVPQAIELTAETSGEFMVAEPVIELEEVAAMEAPSAPKTNPRMRAVPLTDPGSLPPVMEPPPVAVSPPTPRPQPPAGLQPRSGVLSTSNPSLPRPATTAPSPPPSQPSQPIGARPPADPSPRPPTARPGAVTPPPNRNAVTGTPTSVRRPTGGVSSTVVRPPGTIGNAGGAARPVAPTRSAALGIGGRRSPGLATPYGGNKPTAEGVVVARPAVIVGGGGAAGEKAGEAPRPSVSRWHTASTPSTPAPADRPGAPNPADNIFGGDVISEKSLDEVILAYLSEDLSDGKK